MKEHLLQQEPTFPHSQASVQLVSTLYQKADSVAENAEMTLNKGQELANDEILQFLVSDQKEFNLSGAAGTGKTFMMRHIYEKVLEDYKKLCHLLSINNPRKWNVVFTATTNKAADELGKSLGQETSTIHKYLGLRVYNNYTTGKADLSPTQGYREKWNVLLFVDEASMVDSELRQHILHCLKGHSKIIYVGDHSQLKPVGETVSPVYEQGLPLVALTEPMRNNTQPALMNICEQFRETVRTGIFKPIQLVPGVIDWLDGPEMKAEIERLFIDDDVSSRILCHTNNQANEYNAFIRSLRNRGDEYVVGEKLIINSAFQYKSNATVPAETNVTVEEVDPTYTHLHTNLADQDLAIIRCYRVALRIGWSKILVYVPVDKEQYKRVCKQLAKEKDWQSLYGLQEKIPDLRPKDACTVHKAQGSTYDSVFLDLNDIGKSWEPDTVARMLYVGVSRARYRIYLRGYLPIKYGGACISG